MTKMMRSAHAGRGPERLIFDSATVLAGIERSYEVGGFGRGAIITTVRFIQEPDATPMIRESMQEADVRRRMESHDSYGTYNGDAVYWMRKHDELRAVMEIDANRMRALAEQRDNAEREYEASKNMWRKHFVVADNYLDMTRRREDV